MRRLSFHEHPGLTCLLFLETHPRQALTRGRVFSVTLGTRDWPQRRRLKYPLTAPVYPFQCLRTSFLMNHAASLPPCLSAAPARAARNHSSCFRPHLPAPAVWAHALCRGLCSVHAAHPGPGPLFILSLRRSKPLSRATFGVATLSLPHRSCGCSGASLFLPPAQSWVTGHLSSGLDRYFPYISGTIRAHQLPAASGDLWLLYCKACPHRSTSQFFLPPLYRSVVQPTKSRVCPEQNESGPISRGLKSHCSKSTIVSLSFVLCSSKCFPPGFYFQACNIV